MTVACKRKSCEENTTIKKLRSETLSADEFVKLMNSGDNQFEALSIFFAEVEENGNVLLVEEYLKLSPEMNEIFKVLESKKLKHAQLDVIFRTFSSIFTLVVTTIHQYRTLIFPAVRRLLTDFLPCIMSSLGHKNTSGRIKNALKILLFATVLSRKSAEFVLNSVNLKAKLWKPLFKRRDNRDPEDIRQNLITFTCTILLSRNSKAIKLFIQNKEFLSDLLADICFDDVNSVKALIGALKEGIILNPDISKSEKISLFNSSVVKSIARLYQWKGYAGWNALKNKSKILDTKDKLLMALNVPVDEKELNEIRNTVHTFFNLLLCSTKYGIIFLDRGDGSGEKSANHSLVYSLLSFPKPSADELVADLIVNVLRLCPDIVKRYIEAVSHIFRPRDSEKWYRSIRFLSNLIMKQQPLSKFINLNKSSLSELISNYDVPYIIDIDFFKEAFKVNTPESVSVTLDLLCSSVRRFCEIASAISHYENSSLCKTYCLSVLARIPPDGFILSAVRNYMSVSESELNDATISTILEKLFDVFICYHDDRLLGHALRNSTWDFMWFYRNIIKSRSLSVLDRFLKLTADQFYSFEWFKSDKLGISPFLQLLNIASSSFHSLSHCDCLKLVDSFVQFLSRSKLFENNEHELYIWVEEILKSNCPDLLKFFHSVVNTALANPHPYYDVVSTCVLKESERFSEHYSANCIVINIDTVIDKIFGMELDEIEAEAKQYKCSDSLQTFPVVYSTSFPFSILVPIALKHVNDDNLLTQAGDGVLVKIFWKIFCIQPFLQPLSHILSPYFHIFDEDRQIILKSVLSRTPVSEESLTCFDEPNLDLSAKCHSGKFLAKMALTIFSLPCHRKFFKRRTKKFSKLLSRVFLDFLEDFDLHGECLCYVFSHRSVTSSLDDDIFLTHGLKFMQFVDTKAIEKIPIETIDSCVELLTLSSLTRVPASILTKFLVCSSVQVFQNFIIRLASQQVCTEPNFISQILIDTYSCMTRETFSCVIPDFIKLVCMCLNISILDEDNAFSLIKVLCTLTKRCCVSHLSCVKISSVLLPVLLSSDTNEAVEIMTILFLAEDSMVQFWSNETMNNEQTIKSKHFWLVLAKMFWLFFEKFSSLTPCTKYMPLDTLLFLYSFDFITPELKSKLQYAASERIVSMGFNLCDFEIARVEIFYDLLKNTRLTDILESFLSSSKFTEFSWRNLNKFIELKEWLSDSSFYSAFQRFYSLLLTDYYFDLSALDCLLGMVNIAEKCLDSDPIVHKSFNSVTEKIIENPKFIEKFTCHSDFREIVAKILLKTISSYTSFSPKHFGFLLAVYFPNLKMCNQHLLCLMGMYEKHNCSMLDYHSLAWGQNIDLGHTGTSDNAKKSPLDQLDRHLLHSTAVRFPIGRKLQAETFYNPRYNDEELYDPAFLIPLFYHCFHADRLIDCEKVIQDGVLSLCIRAWSSRCQVMREMAHLAIQRFTFHMDKQRFQSKMQILCLLEVFTNSFSCTMRLPSAIALFFAKAAYLMTSPDSSLFIPMNRCLCRFPSIKSNSVPLFMQWLFDGTHQHDRFRTWMLHVLCFGLRDSFDFKFYLSKGLLDVLMSICSSDLTASSEKIQILHMVLHNMKNRAIVFELVHRHGFLTWLKFKIQAANAEEYPVLAKLTAQLHVTIRDMGLPNYKHLIMQIFAVFETLLLHGCSTTQYDVSCGFIKAANDLFDVKPNFHLETKHFDLICDCLTGASSDKVDLVIGLLRLWPPLNSNISSTLKFLVTNLHVITRWDHVFNWLLETRPDDSNTWSPFLIHVLQNSRFLNKDVFTAIGTFLETDKSHFSQSLLKKIRSFL